MEDPTRSVLALRGCAGSVAALMVALVGLNVVFAPPPHYLAWSGRVVLPLVTVEIAVALVILAGRPGSLARIAMAALLGLGSSLLLSGAVGVFLGVHYDSPPLPALILVAGTPLGLLVAFPAFLYLDLSKRLLNGPEG
jgi:hypothetical protein